MREPHKRLLLLSCACLFGVLVTHTGMNAFIAVHKGYSATSASPAGLSHDVGSVEARLQLDIHHQVGVKGLLGFGMGFGILAAIVRSAGRVPMRASGSDIQVAEKTETKPVAYLENVPRSIMEKETLTSSCQHYPESNGKTLQKIPTCIR